MSEPVHGTEDKVQESISTIQDKVVTAYRWGKGWSNESCSDNWAAMPEPPWEHHPLSFPRTPPQHRQESACSIFRGGRLNSEDNPRQVYTIHSHPTVLPTTSLEVTVWPQCGQWNVRSPPPSFLCGTWLRENPWAELSSGDHRGEAKRIREN